MKTEQLIVQYLYSNKKLTLQDIGTFTISPEINIATDSEKEAALLPDSISFDYNPKATEDEGLVNYIVQQTRKIKPLASSDLESFIILSKQFLNIGKPLVLEGLGTLQKAQTGEYAFTQSGTSHVIFEDVPKKVTEKDKANEKVDFSTPPKEKSGGNGKIAVILLLAAILIGGGLTAYYFITKNKTETTVQGTVLTEDTAATATSDTTAVSKPVTAPANVTDTNSFYIVIKEYDTRAAAEKSFQKLTSYGNKVVLSTKDSLRFRVKMPFQLPVSDTVRVKDSLAKFFGGKPFVEMP